MQETHRTAQGKSRGWRPGLCKDPRSTQRLEVLSHALGQTLTLIWDLSMAPQEQRHWGELEVWAKDD
jgi:hypothetical protein